MYVMLSKPLIRSHELREMTMAQYRAMLASAPGDTFVMAVSAQTARRHVRNGGQHTTPLYVNSDGAVRYAKG